jgi:hypothetical protein
MTRPKLAIVQLALVIACLTFPAAVHAQCTRCCFPYPNLTLNPSTAQEGEPVIVTTVLLNCSPYSRVLTAKVNVTPPSACAKFAEAFSTSAYVPPFQSRTVTYTFAAPKCRGTYEVTESSSNASGYATRTLTVY